MGCPVYGGARLLPQNVIPGPAIVEKRGVTIVMPPGQHATVDPWLNFAIAPEG